MITYFDKPTEIRQTAVALNICVFQQLRIFVSNNSHQLLKTHEDEIEAR